MIIRPALSSPGLSRIDVLLLYAVNKDTSAHRVMQGKTTERNETGIPVIALRIGMNVGESSGSLVE